MNAIKATPLETSEKVLRATETDAWVKVRILISATADQEVAGMRLGVHVNPCGAPDYAAAQDA